MDSKAFLHIKIHFDLSFAFCNIKVQLHELLMNFMISKLGWGQLGQWYLGVPYLGKATTVSVGTHWKKRSPDLLATLYSNLALKLELKYIGPYWSPKITVVNSTKCMKHIKVHLHLKFAMSYGTVVCLPIFLHFYNTVLYKVKYRNQ